MFLRSELDVGGGRIFWNFYKFLKQKLSEQIMSSAYLVVILGISHGQLWFEYEIHNSVTQQRSDVTSSSKSDSWLSTSLKNSTTKQLSKDIPGQHWNLLIPQQHQMTSLIISFHNYDEVFFSGTFLRLSRITHFTNCCASNRKNASMGFCSICDL